MTRRRLETRARLTAATLGLLIDKGVDRTTMDAITEAADLGRRTLYYHFDSKEACIVAAVASVYADHAALADESNLPDEDPADVIARNSQRVIAGILSEPVTASLVGSPRILAAAIKEATAEFARRDVNRGVASGRFRTVVAEDIVDRILVWALVGLLIESAEGSIKKRETRVAYAVLVLVNLGLSGDEARAIAESVAV